MEEKIDKIRKETNVREFLAINEKVGVFYRKSMISRIYLIAIVNHYSFFFYWYLFHHHDILREFADRFSTTVKKALWVWNKVNFRRELKLESFLFGNLSFKYRALPSKPERLTSKCHSVTDIFFTFPNAINQYLSPFLKLIINMMSE